MKIQDAYELLAKEYISKCKCCDECIASYYCTINQLRTCREPQENCAEYLKKYLRQGVSK